MATTKNKSTKLGGQYGKVFYYDLKLISSNYNAIATNFGKVVHPREVIVSLKLDQEFLSEKLLCPEQGITNCR